MVAMREWVTLGLAFEGAALFALGLIVTGIARGIAAARWAGLDQLYRVGALVGVAAIAITASALYQRFTSAQAARERA
jgi:multisubunit Na+/H+ antiporter MnhB subunit